MNSVGSEVFKKNDLSIRNPSAVDGSSVHSLIERCPPLDTNSMYCNLLQCEHFAQTSAITMQGEKAVGFISAYVIPSKPDVLFIWQVAVDESVRGLGLASKMLHFILQKNASSDIAYLETTITQGNDASWALFTKLAESLDTSITSGVFFDKQRHFNGAHDTEHLVKIGPL